MGYFALYLLIFVIIKTLEGWIAQYFDFCDKYYKKELLDVGKFKSILINYKYEIDYDKSIKYNVTITNGRNVKKNTNIGKKSLYFQLFNYIFFIICWSLVILKILFLSNELFDVIYKLVSIITLFYSFILLILVLVYSFIIDFKK